MEWDLGIGGIGLLAVLSLGFGAFAGAVLWSTATRWSGLIAAVAMFGAGILISEVWFGWATEEDLQPNIDGLSFEEVLLIGILPGIVAVLVTRYLFRRHRHHRPIIH